MSTNPKRPRGRPRLCDDGAIYLTLAIPTSVMDRVERLAPFDPRPATIRALIESGLEVAEAVR